MKRILLFYCCILYSLLSTAQTEAYFDRLYPFQPNIVFGGHAVCMSTNPSNDNEVLAVSRLSGIMKTTDRGRNWRTLFGLPAFWVTYVRHAPGNPNNIIATALNIDYSTGNGTKGGIWLSQDGGETWERPDSGVPSTGRIEAYCIATYPGSRRVMVGTNMGLAISDDNGVTWTYQSVPGTTVNAVALLRGDNMVISTSMGIYLWSGFSRSWLRERTGIGMAYGANSFDVPHNFMSGVTTASPLFVTTASGQIRFSNNGGLDWSMVDTLPQPVNGAAGGTFFVKAARNWFNDGIDLFVSNNYGVWRKHCPRTGPNFSIRFNERWNAINTRHEDISDLCLDRTGEAYLLATDGGVQRFWRDISGDNFSFDEGGGSSRNGFHGLQITEVQGTYINSRGNFDLYFGTQDNRVWASENAGVNWIEDDCCEGYTIEVPRTANTESEVKVAYVACAPCTKRISRRMLRDVRLVIEPVVNTSSLKYLQNNTYISFSTERSTIAGRTPYTTRYFLTQNYTSPDISASDLRQPELLRVPYLVPRNLQKVSGPSGSQVLYHAYKDYRGQYNTDSDTGLDVGSAGIDDLNIQRVKLARMSLNIFPGGGLAYEHRFPAMRNFGSIGVYRTEFSWYEMFAPDPANPQHIIAADAINRRMAQSTNGGDDWVPISILTDMLTAGGTKRFTQGRFTNVSCISFNPSYPQLVIVGTCESGLFYSWNNGTDWQSIPGSTVIPEISSVFWQNNNTAIVSSYGRGLYKVEFRFDRPRFRLASLLLDSVFTYIRPDLLLNLRQSNFQSQEFDAAYIVTDGAIENLRLKDNYVSAIFVSPNASALIYTDVKGYKLPFATEMWDPATMKPDFAGFDKLTYLKEKGYSIIGVFLKNGQLVDVLYGQKPIPWPEPVKYEPFKLVGEKELKIEGKRLFTVTSDNMLNGYCYVGEDRKITLEGYNFPLNLPKPFDLLIDGKPASFLKPITPDKAGNFSVTVSVANLSLGAHTITIYQYDNQQQRISETEEFIILNGDKAGG